jgi:hypothetical protein
MKMIQISCVLRKEKSSNDIKSDIESVQVDRTQHVAGTIFKHYNFLNICSKVFGLQLEKLKQNFPVIWYYGVSFCYVLSEVFSF